MEIKKEWYKKMSFYQIWPRSFKDGNGDGVGDLKGVLEKLDYIKSLNVDAIWFSPLYKSPNKDYGYDISDYRDINPEFGTLDDMKKVIDEAHKRGLKIIMDLVINHTSSEHAWFKEARKSVDNPYHDYYLWRKGKGKNGKRPPNNWASNFPGSAWEYVPECDEYYLHLFDVGQPDLNMDNPKVREEIKGIIRFWLDLGIDGFREDVINYISKKEGLPNGFPLPAMTGMEHYVNGPHLKEYLMEFRKVYDEYDEVMTVGEAPLVGVNKMLDFIGEGEGQVLRTMFQFEQMEGDCFKASWMRTGFSLPKLKRIYNKWQSAFYGKAWNTLFLENHDQPRIINRYGNPEMREESGKMLATMYILLCGNPYVYQGQEIGMLNIELPTIDDYPDVNSKTFYNLFRKLGFSDKFAMGRVHYSARDNARTPVQWDNGKNAGFTTGTPWFTVNPNYTEINVKAEEENPSSVLNHYRKVLKLRKENEVAIYGDFTLYYPRSKKWFVYSREYEGKKMLVICSFSKNNETFKTPKGYDLKDGKLLLSTYLDGNDITEKGFEARPYEARVYLFD